MSGRLLGELRRRRVGRVVAVYIITAWLVIQFADVFFPAWNIPETALRYLLAAAILGFPIALVFGWKYDITSDGIQRTPPSDGGGVAGELNRGDFITLVTLAIAAVLLISSIGAGILEVVQNAEPRRAAVQMRANSVAVLPFVNMSPDEEQEWFSDGLTEEIMNALSRTPDLLVAARTSSFKFKDSNEDIPTIAKALGVAHVLEGSVRRGEGRLRVTAQLIRANDGFHVWSQNYDRKPEDVIRLQEEVAITIATALQTAMNPESLAKMVSSGTRSVEAYNAYLRGLAYDASTLSTGDVYEFLDARDAFERAVELDQEFALAYWELANFWEVQLRTTNIVGGTVELTHEEMKARFDVAIDNAIRFEKSPVNKIRFRVLQSTVNRQFPRALRLNTEYLQQRPNDQEAQNVQLSILATLSIDDRLIVAISEYQARDGYDVAVTNRSIAYSLISDDKAFIRAYVTNALERVGDSAFVMYQAHRALLWAGDIDAASELLPLLRSSDVPEENRLIVELRQACAENRMADAVRTYERIKSTLPDDTSIMWISHKIMNQHEDAHAILADLDARMDLGSLSNFLSYAYFDARPYPNLMAMLNSQGVDPREPRDVPYRCKH